MEDDQELRERKRLEELRKYEILDTPSEMSYNDIVSIASMICGTPIALISLVDDKRQWFKAAIGLDAKETSRDVAFCNQVVLDRKWMVVEDATQDFRFKNNPLVTGEPHIRFYAGYPLFSNEHVLGTLCVIDMKPRELEPHRRAALEILARQVMYQLKLRLTLRDLRESQTLLVKENERYSNLVDHLKEAVFQTDIDGKWIFLSPAWEEILGYKIGDSVGQNFIDYVFPDDRALNMEKFRPLIAREKEYCRHQIRYLKSNGEICWIEVFARLTFNSEGGIQGTTGTLTDVTEKKKQEKLIEDQRMQMIHSARLYSLGEMAAGIAHEINNPLAIIRGTVQMLDASVSTSHANAAEVREAIDKIDSTVGRIAKIISSLRSFARDGEKDAFVSVQMSSIISDALELCQTRFKNGGVLVEYDRGISEIRAECRPVQISQVLLNLLNNAFDALVSAPRKNIKIKLMEDDDDVLVKILDSGQGVPPEIKERIMDPFFSTKGPSRGMGLGLSLSKGLIESHNGSLWHDVEDGMTCFTIRIAKKQTRGI